MNLRQLLVALVAAGLALPAAAGPVFTDQVEVELIAETQHARPGETLWVALRLRPEPGWHTYWQNPGDSGLPTRLEWLLPEGVTAGDIHWPHPKQYRLGDLVNYGYGEETMHLVPLAVPADWPVGQPLLLAAGAHWLVCKDICIPGSAQLELSVPTAAGVPAVQAHWAPSFASARRALPQDADWTAHYAISRDTFSLAVAAAAVEDVVAVEFYPLANELVQHSAPQRVALTDGDLRVSQQLSDYFVDAPDPLRGVLVLRRDGGEPQAYAMAAEPGEVAAVPLAAAAAASAAPPGGGATTALPVVLLFAFVGGLILNLMPCVFPVLSIKAISVMQGAHQGSQRHALAYTAGVIVSAVAAAALLLALRAGGAALGWGFQLQEPLFVIALAYIMFALGLSLSGVVQFGTRFMGVGQQLTQRGGLGSSFFTGVLAVVVASPCTAPFMGTALGYAVTQPAAVALSVFAMLGLGLAFPFLLIGFVPALARWLPRPGAWMETFKQFMAFPLYLTVVWLLWVLARQTSADVLAAAGAGLVLLAFAVWLIGRGGGRMRAVVAAAAVVAAVWLPAQAPLHTDSRQEAGMQALEQAWSPQRVQELRSQGRTVFVNFTADWCLSCKFNERAVLAGGTVQRAFAQRGVVYLKGDWTRPDPEITRVLESFGRSGVPLYLVYPNGADPVVLPQILTTDLVLSAIP